MSDCPKYSHTFLPVSFQQRITCLFYIILLGMHVHHAVPESAPESPVTI